MTLPFTHVDWAAVVPLEVLAATGLLVLLLDLLWRPFAPRALSLSVAVLGTIVTVVMIAQQYGTNVSAFNGGYVVGNFSVLFSEVILLGTLGALALMGRGGSDRESAGTIALLLWSACGALLLAAAATTMTIFLGIELLSLALYCLCGLANRKSAREAALKYLLLSSTASAVLLFGMALLFGASGSVSLAALATPAMVTNPLFWMGSGFFLVGIAFKLSLVPFHAWAPDVYQGAPLPIAAFMTVVTKAATIAIFARFAYAALPVGASQMLLLPIWVIAGISMIVGNVGMLAQHDLKRLLGYSGIAQVGYILAALAGTTKLGLRYAFFYLAVYAVMNLGAFAVAAVLSSSDEEEGTHLESYRGLGARRPLLAAAMTFFLLALAGLPPTAGFLGKILILAVTAGSGYLWLAALLLLGTAISLYAYAKIILAMYRPDHRVRSAETLRGAPLPWLSLALCLVATVALTFYPLLPSGIVPLVK